MGVILDPCGRLGVHSTASPNNIPMMMMVNSRRNLWCLGFWFFSFQPFKNYHCTGPGAHDVFGDNFKPQGSVRMLVPNFHPDSANGTFLLFGSMERLNERWLHLAHRWLTSVGLGCVFKSLFEISQSTSKTLPPPCKSRSGYQKVFADLWHEHTGVNNRTLLLTTDHSYPAYSHRTT